MGEVRGVCCRWGAKAQLISRRDPSSQPSEFSYIFLAWLCFRSCRVMARQLGWPGEERVKLTTKMSLPEITGPLLGRQKPPCGC